MQSEKNFTEMRAGLFRKKRTRDSEREFIKEEFGGREDRLTS